MSQKIAVVLFNLGGPDSLTSVYPFLFNLFSDKAILSWSQPWRYMLALLISTLRAPKARAIYAMMGGSSSIVPQTVAQVQALQEVLVQSKEVEYKVFYCMRYWHPMSPQVVQEVQEWGPSKIILLPLYPQFSTSTTASSIENWQQSAATAGLQVPTNVVCCYPKASGFVRGYAQAVRQTYAQALKQVPDHQPRVLFSAHGLPLKRIKQGDPYQSQIEASVSAVVEEIGIKSLDYRICYQSKVGPLRWLEPSTHNEIIQAGLDQVSVIIVPIAFVSEHSETKVELDIEYRKLATAHRVPGYFRVNTLSTDTLFIECLAALCCEPNTSTFRCADGFSQCYCRTS